jgi:hypothetical protein
VVRLNDQSNLMNFVLFLCTSLIDRDTIEGSIELLDFLSSRCTSLIDHDKIEGLTKLFGLKNHLDAPSSINHDTS